MTIQTYLQNKEKWLLYTISTHNKSFHLESPRPVSDYRHICFHTVAANGKNKQVFLVSMVDGTSHYKHMEMMGKVSTFF